MIVSRRRRFVVLGAAAAVVVVALLVVVLVVRPGAHRPVSAPAPTPAAAASSAGLAVRDEREVTFEELTVTLPGNPFSCHPPLPTPPPGFDAYVSCFATVHEDFDGVGGSWGAQVGVVVLDDASGSATDLDRSSARAFRTLYRSFYTADDSPVLSDQVGEPVTIHGPAGSAYRHRARVVVDRKDLTTAYDRLSVEVVRLRSGRVAAFFSDVPDDAEGDLLRAALVSQVSVTLL